MNMFVLRIDENSTFDSKLVQLAENMFDTGTVLQNVLHAHLLVERALIGKISKKMAEPSAFGPKSRWTFANLSHLYVGLYGSKRGEEQMLRQLNSLRNAVAHTLGGVSEAVDKYIPVSREQKLDDHRLRVAIFSLVLLYNLGAISGIEPGNLLSSS